MSNVNGDGNEALEASALELTNRLKDCTDEGLAFAINEQLSEFLTVLHIRDITQARVIRNMAVQANVQRKKHSPAPPQKPKCAVCFDELSGNSFNFGCEHSICIPCFRRWIEACSKDRQYFPLKCVECEHLLDCNRSSFQALMDFRFLAKILRFQEESTLKDALFCPNKRCGVLLKKPRGTIRIKCPKCKEVSCAECKVGYHDGMTCRQYQKLPFDQRSPEDVALMKLTVERNWKQCPNCRMTVSKISGCNSMSCRCGTQFCYSCGGKHREGAACYEFLRDEYATVDDE